MTAIAISKEVAQGLETFLKKFRKVDVVTAYLYFLEKKHRLAPVLCPKEKTVYKSIEDAVRLLEKEGKLWKETEIKLGFGPPTINDETKKVYICPFTGKVFGDNTHPNPQDAIYDWVANCPENTERSGGLRVKRFYVSEDPGIIKNYITPRKKPISKIVYSSVFDGKLYNQKESLIEDFKANYLKPMTLVEAQNQNRFQLDPSFLNFVQSELEESKITSFVEALSSMPAFNAFVKQWVEEGEEEEEEVSEE